VNLGFCSRKHLKVSNAVSSGVSFFTTHLLAILSTSSSSTATLFSLILIWSAKTSPASFIKPDFLPKQRLCALILSSTLSKWLVRSWLMPSGDTPVSSRHSSLHFFQLAFCSSVKVWAVATAATRARQRKSFMMATVLSATLRGVLIPVVIGFGVRGQE
jgi:hypothetical protein